MTEPILTRHAIGGQLVRKGRGTITPPNAPTNLVATPGNAQIGLTWTASTTPGVTYQIKRVNADAVVWSGAGLSAVIGALTNDVTYNFQVYAITSSGQLSAPSNIATGVPRETTNPNPNIDVLYGYNWNNDTVHQSQAGRKSHFNNRVPCIRHYSPNYLVPEAPAHWYTGATEGRMCTSFKAGGGYSESQLATSPAVLDDMISHLESLRVDTKYYWVHHHEPNSSGGLEVPAAQFVQVYDQMMEAKAQASLRAGVEVYICANFMAYQVDTSNWSDSWVPNCDILTWDIYGNPGVNTPQSGSNKYGGPATGSAYNTLYPEIVARCAPMFRVTERTGFADSWGVLEVNTPLRNWDNNENGRVLWHEDMLEHFNSPPMRGAVPPKIMLLWEAPSGVNWRQQYGNNLPAGTNTGDPANSPMWDVWLPYMNGVPLP